LELQKGSFPSISNPFKTKTKGKRKTRMCCGTLTTKGYSWGDDDPPPLTCTVVVLKGWRSKSMEASTSKAGVGQSVRNGGSLRKVASGLLLLHSPLPFMFPSRTLQNTKFLCWKLHSRTHPWRKSSGDSPLRVLDRTFPSECEQKSGILLTVEQTCLYHKVKSLVWSLPRLCKNDQDWNVTLKIMKTSISVPNPRSECVSFWKSR
jgi:hypothetical protein